MPTIRLSDKELKQIVAQEGYSVQREFGGKEPERGMTEAHKKLVRAQNSTLENKFLDLWTLAGGKVEDWKRNLRFDLPESRMELDFAMPELKIAVEVNGGQGKGSESGHGNWKGLERDAKKQNRCVSKGWTLFWLTTSTVTLDEINRIMAEVKGRKS